MRESERERYMNREREMTKERERDRESEIENETLRTLMINLIPRTPFCRSIRHNPPPHSRLQKDFLIKPEVDTPQALR